LATLLVGCQQRVTDYDLARATMAYQNVREIEPLELTETDPNEVAAPDVNEPPPETLELSLEQCRALALENNLELKADLISPAIAAEGLNAEEAKFEASFFANASYLKTDQPSGRVLEVDGSFVPVIEPSQSERINSDLGVRVPLRTGGTVIFDLADFQTENLLIPPGLFNPAYANTFLISVSQPLLRDAGRWVNTHSIRIAAYSSQISEARARLDVIVVLAALDRVYWRLYAARRELEVRQQQYELAQAQLEQAQHLADLGQRAKVEVVRAEAGVAQQLEAIILAENSLRQRERELKRVINKAGLSMQTPTVLIPSTEPDPVLYALERPKLVRTALDSRMELLELQLQLLQDASTVDFSRNQTLPAAALGYSYNINATGTTRNDSLDLLLSNDYGDHRVTLQVAVPIGNEAAKSRLRQAIYTRRQRLATRADRERVIELEVLNAVDQVEANWQRILAARQTTVLNARVFEAEKRQFEQGLRTSTEVLDAQINFANAQSAEIQALAEYQIALVDLAYATGTLLGAARIHWEPIVPPTDVQ
jgi:outer membrane protein TolC